MTKFSCFKNSIKTSVIEFNFCEVKFSEILDLLLKLLLFWIISWDKFWLSFCKILLIVFIFSYIRSHTARNTSRSSRSQILFKIGVLRSFAIFTGKHMCLRRCDGYSNTGFLGATFLYNNFYTLAASIHLSTKNYFVFDHVFFLYDLAKIKIVWEQKLQNWLFEI